MPQQINLSTPVLLVEKRYFSALAMLQTLVALVVLGGALTAYGVVSLRSATAQMRSTGSAQAAELATLRATLAAAPAEGSVKQLEQDLAAAQAQLTERSETLAELRRGVLAPGSGHSDRLKLVAASIPESAWVTEILADPARIEVRGFTHDPAALNPWIARMAQSALLTGQTLRKVRVEAVGGASAGTRPATGGSPDLSTGRPVWSFVLGSGAAATAPFAEGKAP
jgi:Tfp pilus assembly protein PilN